MTWHREIQNRQSSYHVLWQIALLITTQKLNSFSFCRFYAPQLFSTFGSGRKTALLQTVIIGAGQHLICSLSSNPFMAKRAVVPSRIKPPILPTLPYLPHSSISAPRLTLIDSTVSTDPSSNIHPFTPPRPLLTAKCLVQ